MLNYCLNDAIEFCTNKVLSGYNKANIGVVRSSNRSVPYCVHEFHTGRSSWLESLQVDSSTIQPSYWFDRFSLDRSNAYAASAGTIRYSYSSVNGVSHNRLGSSLGLQGRLFDGLISLANIERTIVQYLIDFDSIPFSRYLTYELNEETEIQEQGWVLLAQILYLKKKIKRIFQLFSSVLDYSPVIPDTPLSTLSVAHKRLVWYTATC